MRATINTREAGFAHRAACHEGGRLWRTGEGNRRRSELQGGQTRSDLRRGAETEVSWRVSASVCRRLTIGSAGWFLHASKSSTRASRYSASCCVSHSGRPSATPCHFRAKSTAPPMFDAGAAPGDDRTSSARPFGMRASAVKSGRRCRIDRPRRGPAAPPTSASTSSTAGSTGFPTFAHSA